MTTTKEDDKSSNISVKCEAMERLEKALDELCHSIMDDPQSQSLQQTTTTPAGLVFDCDGTLLDTMPIYYESWSRTCNELDLHFPIERFYSMAGATVESIFEMLLEEADDTTRARQLKLTAQDCEAIKRKHHHDVENEGGGRVAGPIDVVVEIAKRFHGKLPLAVASSGWRDHVIGGLERNGILHLFDAIVTADEEEVKEPKPAPDIFLEAARRLRVCPTKCVGFEDADLGMEAIRRARYAYAADVRCFYEYPRNVDERSRNTCTGVGAEGNADRS